MLASLTAKLVHDPFADTINIYYPSRYSQNSERRTVVDGGQHYGTGYRRSGDCVERSKPSGHLLKLNGGLVFMFAGL
jgi:hypothetical protein